MRRIILLIMAMVLGLSTFAFCGCNSYAKELTFLAFPQYKSVGSKTTTSIKVEWDNGDGEKVIFDITETATVNTVTDKLFNQTKFIKAGTTMNDGGHSSITLIHSNETETKILLSQIQYGTEKQFYSYENDEFYNLIKQIGENLGKI